MAILRFLACFVVLLSIVPLAGLLVSGSWRGAAQFTKDWFTILGYKLLVAAVLVLGMVAVMPP